MSAKASALMIAREKLPRIWDANRASRPSPDALPPHNGFYSFDSRPSRRRTGQASAIDTNELRKELPRRPRGSKAGTSASFSG
jgi:hypothetical protein